MRVLLIEGAERAIAETILTLDGFSETVWGPLLAADTYRLGREAFVVEVGDPVVSRAITSAVRRGHPSRTAQQLFKEVWWMGRMLRRYVIGSRIRLHLTVTGCVLDCSRAILTAAAETECRAMA